MWSLWSLLCIFRYGQMTAGSYCYIGPQGIVHGTMVCNNYKQMHTTQSESPSHKNVLMHAVVPVLDLY